MMIFVICLAPFIYLAELIFLWVLINKNKEIEKQRQNLLDEYVRVAELLDSKRETPS